MAINETKTLIVGGGAKGCYLCARLIEKEIGVDLLTGAPRHDHLSLRGLVVASPFGRFRGPVKAIVRPEPRFPYHLIVLTVRAHLLEAAVAGLNDAIVPSTVILLLVDGGPYSNGLQKRFPENRVYEGIFEGRLLTDVDGRIIHRLPQARILIGTQGPADRIAPNMATLLTGRGVQARVDVDAPRRQWARSIFLASGVGTTIMTGRPLRDTLRFHPGRAFFSYMLAEGREVAAAAGHRIDRNDTWRYRYGLFLEGEPVATPPQIGDPREAGIEALHLVKAMVDRARTLGVAAPTLMKALEAASAGVDERHDVSV